jgi:hypothetical protein
LAHELGSAAFAGSSERVQKAAAEAAAETMRAAAMAGGDAHQMQDALRRGMLLLLHTLPAAAQPAAAPVAQQAQQPVPAPGPQQPRVSQLAVAVAEAAAFNTLLQLLQQGGSAAGAAFATAHFWLGPLLGTALGTSARQRQRSPTLFGIADKAARQLLQALVVGEVAALAAAAGGSASSAICQVPGADVAAVATVASAAAQAGDSWYCLPAMWQALSHCAEHTADTSTVATAEGSTLLLAAAAALAAIAKGGGGGAARSGAAASLPAPAGFNTSGLSSALASDIQAAQQLPSLRELQRRYLQPGEQQPNTGILW